MARTLSSTTETAPHLGPNINVLPPLHKLDILLFAHVLPAYTKYSPSRGRSILSNLTQFTLSYLVMDFVAYYAPTDPFLHNLSSLNSPLPPSTASLLSTIHPSFSAHPIIIKLLRLTLPTMQFMAAISLSYTISTILCFSLPSLLPVTWSSPRSWPPAFGPFTAIFTHGLKGLWGTFWHRSLRY